MLEKAELLEAFQRLMNCCYPVWSWELDENFEVISTDCPSPEVYRKMFLQHEYREAAKNHLCGNGMPLICTLAAVISWAMAFDAAETDGKRIHVIGPFFSGYKDEENTREIFRILDLDETEQEQIMDSSRKIPMLTSSTMIQYSIMLHYCVREEKIEAKDIDYCLVRMPHRRIRGQVVSAEMMLDYAQRVKRAKETLQCSGKIRLCCEYIDTHPEEKITLDIMAEKSEYTPAHLSRKFRSEIGCTITQYIQNSKIEHAKEQLAMTDITVEEISGKLGFGTRSYFSTVFRKLTGETPNEYRRKYKVV